MGELSQRIQLAAAKLFFRRGIKNVSMDDLSKKLKISKKTLYHCFGNKNELVLETIRQHFHDINQSLERIHSEPLTAISKMWKGAQFAVTTLSEVQPPMLEDLNQYYPEIYQELVDGREQMILAYLKRNIEEGRSQGLYRENFNSELICLLFAHQMVFIAEDWSRKNITLTKNAVMEFSEYHLRGISTEKGIMELNTLIHI